MGTFGLTLFVAVLMMVVLALTAGRLLWRHRLAWSLAAMAAAAFTLHLTLSVTAYWEFVNLILVDVDEWGTAPIAALPTWVYDAPAIASIILTAGSLVTHIVNRTKKGDIDGSVKGNGLAKEALKRFDEPLPDPGQTKSPLKK